MAPVKVEASVPNKVEVVNHFADYDMWRAKRDLGEKKRLVNEKRQRTRMLNKARADTSNPAIPKTKRTKKADGPPPRRRRVVDKDTRDYLRRALNFSFVRDIDFEPEVSEEVNPNMGPHPQPSAQPSNSGGQDMFHWVRPDMGTRGRGRGGRAAARGAARGKDGVSSTRGRGGAGGARRGGAAAARRGRAGAAAMRGRGGAAASGGRGRGGVALSATTNNTDHNYAAGSIRDGNKGGWAAALGILSPNELQAETSKVVQARKPTFVGYEDNDEDAAELRKYWDPVPQQNQSYKTEFKSDEPMPDEEEQNENDGEEMGVEETYSDYMPAKLKIGKRHPDSIVETASLASVLPPDVTYELKLPKSLIKNGLLSALQLESIVYASQQHAHILPNGERAGFLIGDGAGVGKGRTIAGIIYENFLRKRKKSLWITVSNDLKYDTERDLSDIGANIPIHQLNKFKYGKIDNFKDGVLFLTYSGLIGESSTKSKINSRLKQILHWCGPNFDGLVVFDECHRAKNLFPNQGRPTKTGITVQKLQESLPKARVVYASATGASEPKNMAYMTRLGVWGEKTPFRDFKAFINGVERRGVGAMEIVAMDMKLRGAYIARQLSFKGVRFTIEEVPVSESMTRAYDASVEFWVDAMNKFVEGTVLMNYTSKQRKCVWTAFWGAHQRFFKYLCIASKVKHTIQLARNSVKDGKCVVIGLQSTGEARTLDQLDKDDGELADFVSTAKGVLQNLVEKIYPAPNGKNEPVIPKAFGTIVQLRSPEKQKEYDELNKIAFQDWKKAQAGSSSGSNRKPVRRAAQKHIFNQTKRQKHNSSSDEPSAEDDSEYEVGSEMSESDDGYEYNPFLEDPSLTAGLLSGSDSEDEEFSDEYDSDGCYTGKRRRAKKKKRQTTKKVKVEEVRIPPSSAAKSAAFAIRKELLERIEVLGAQLPPNTLDQLIDELGGSAEVAEMTGRKGRVVQDDQGVVSYETRSEAEVSLETINLKEKERFMTGEKLIAIISEAASSGISLQSDKRVKNQRQRVHITLELPWSADRAVQQFGRTHRSNQANAPEYIFLISNMAGEQRFASIIAKRLECLGALTHGDRRATETRDFSRYNIDTKYGRSALEAVMRTVMGDRDPSIPFPVYTNDAGEPGNFQKDVASALVGVGVIVNNPKSPGATILDKDLTMIKFLNRILGMPIRVQNLLFQYFTDTLAHIVKQAKRYGRFDLGILDITGSSKDVKLAETKQYEKKHATGVAQIELHKLYVNRGMDWEEALSKELTLVGKYEGFYRSKRVWSGKHTAILIMRCKDDGSKEKKSDYYLVYKPNIGLQPGKETFVDIEIKYNKVTPEEAKTSWESQYEASMTTCTHAYWSGNCKNKILTKNCEVGIRKRTYYVLSGSVLLVWGEVERVMTEVACDDEAIKMQIVRVRGTQFKIVGLLVPNHCIELLEAALRTSKEIVPLGNDDEIMDN